MSSLMAVFLFLWRSPGPLWISSFLCNSSEPWPSSLASWDSVFGVGVPREGGVERGPQARRRLRRAGHLALRDSHSCVTPHGQSFTPGRAAETQHPARPGTIRSHGPGANPRS